MNRDPLREHIANPRGRSSLSPRALMNYAATHGRYWNPIGVALMFVIVIAAIVIALEYTDAGKMLVAAWEANTAEVRGLRTEVAELRAARMKDRVLLEKIDAQLEVNGKADATTRLVRLEKNDLLTGRMLVELNGGMPNPSFPEPGKYGFKRALGLPEPIYAMFTTDYQWTMKPE